MSNELTQRYWSTLTVFGEKEYTLAQLEDRAVRYANFVFGDGGGEHHDPDKNRATLVREVHSAPITAIYSKPENPNWLYIETVIPGNVGGWWVREIGVETPDGELLAIGSYPASYKPTLEANGVGRDLKVTLVVLTTSSAPPELVIDSSAVYATHASIESGIAEHNQDPSAHAKATIENYGFTRLASNAETKANNPRNDIAVTPDGLQKLLTFRDAGNRAKRHFFCNF